MNAKFSEITCEIKELKKTNQTQNETIMAALSTQKVVTGKPCSPEKHNVAIKNVFPINTFDELKALDDVITEENRQIYTSAMKLPKALTTVPSVQLIIAINIDGTHGKKRLKDYEKVFDALMDAVWPLCDDSHKELRNALAVIKKRHFHNVCVDKKNK